MFDWFNNTFRRREYTKPQGTDLENIAEDMKKIIPFPKAPEAPPMPEVKPPKKDPATVYYRLGVTSDKRVSLQVGYSEITMNSVGVDNLIAQLEMFKDHIKEMEGDDE